MVQLREDAIVPLTYNRAKVETAIDAMTASGSTVIAEGLAWGWRVLSPTEPFTKVEASAHYAADTISSYNNPRWRKVLVLMTDGENDVLSNGQEINSLNGTWYSAYGRGKERLPPTVSAPRRRRPPAPRWTRR